MAITFSVADSAAATLVKYWLFRWFCDALLDVQVITPPSSMRLIAVKARTSIKA